MGCKSVFLLTVLAVVALAVWVQWFSDVPIPQEYDADDRWKVKVIDALGRAQIGLVRNAERMRLRVDRPTTILRGLIETIQVFSSTGKPGGLEEDPDVKVTEVAMGGVKVRAYDPRVSAGLESRPAIVYFHGGGFAFFSPQYTDHFTRKLAKGTGALVFSVDYRLAPQHPFPAAVEDALAVVKYVRKHSQSLGVNKRHVMVAGDSAGGNLAAVVSQLMPRAVKMQILINPWLQMVDFLTPSFQEKSSEDGMLKGTLTPELLASTFCAYVNIPAAKYRPHVIQNNHTTTKLKFSPAMENLNSQRHLPKHLVKSRYSTKTPSLVTHDELADRLESVLASPRMSPALAMNVSGLPPAYLLVGGHDPLRDETIMYASRLLEAGTPVKLEFYPEGFHQFILYQHGPLKLKLAHRALADLLQFVTHQIHTWQGRAMEGVAPEENIPKGHKMKGDPSKCPFLHGKKKT